MADKQRDELVADIAREAYANFLAEMGAPYAATGTREGAEDSNPRMALVKAAVRTTIERLTRTPDAKCESCGSTEELETLCGTCARNRYADWD